jgi:hypothetical protein
MFLVMNEMKSHYGDEIDKYQNALSFSESNKRVYRTIRCFVDGCLFTPLARCILCSKYCCYNHIHICLQTHPNEIEIINQIRHEQYIK